MYILRVDPDLCTKCEECEIHLRGLLENVERFATIFISPTNLYKHSINISRAIESCKARAIDIEDFTDD